MSRSIRAILLASIVMMPVAAHAQRVGGNASIAVTGTSANVQLPASTTTFPALLLAPAVGVTQEIFYALGAANTVTAVAPSLPSTQGSPALPAGGICLAAGPNTYVAAITATSTATLRITQLSQCPLR